MSEMLPEFTGGRTTARDKLNRIVGVINSGLVRPGDGSVLSQQTLLGLSLRVSLNRLGSRVPNLSPDGTVAAENVSTTEDVPQFGLVWVTGMEEAGVRGVNMPDGAFADRLAIAAEEILIGKFGRIWVEGIHPLAIYNYGDLLPADFPFRAVARRNTFYARKHFGDGDIRVWSDTTVEPYVYAEILTA